MRIVFMGSSPLGCPTLSMLFDSPADELVAVVTQPDRPKGRHLVPAACATKLLAEHRDTRVLTPRNVNDQDAVARLQELKPDLVILVAYGQILRKPVLNLPRLGCVNLHASLLPAYRGAAPIQWALANGETRTGVTTMYMNERMDAGDIILQREMPILDEDTAGTLHDKLAELGAPLVGETLDSIRAGDVPRLPQHDSDATFAPKLTKQDGRIDWRLSAEDIYNRVRGFNPWPCSHCRVPERMGGGLLRILAARVEAPAADMRESDPGCVIDAAGDGPLVATGEGGVRLLSVQPEGRRLMTGHDYMQGHDMRRGDILT